MRVSQAVLLVCTCGHLRLLLLLCLLSLWLQWECAHRSSGLACLLLDIKEATNRNGCSGISVLASKPPTAAHSIADRPEVRTCPLLAMMAHIRPPSDHSRPRWFPVGHGRLDLTTVLQCQPRWPNVPPLLATISHFSSAFVRAVHAGPYHELPVWP